MTRTILLAATLSAIVSVASAQATAPAAAAASTPQKHRWVKKLKNHKPGAPATNPQTSSDKKGGA